MSRTQRSVRDFEERTFDADPSLLIWLEEHGGIIRLVVADATPAAPEPRRLLLHALAGLRKLAEMGGHDARR